ncbi:MAG: OmpA family protein, partial [Candidatus Promineifilaceae bacterium]|nr:OmpA family protein [Candidatus Promineifilaceae bacterium]
TPGKDLKIGADRIKFNAVKVESGEIPADGKSATKLDVKVSPPTRPVKWDIVGPDYGSTIDANGRLVPGKDLKGKEKVTLKVKAYDAEYPQASSLGTVTLWDAKLWQAKTDFPWFFSGFYPFMNFRPYNFGKFDIMYLPAAKRVLANMRVKFEFPDDPVPKRNFRNLWGFFGGEDPKKVKARHQKYINSFITQVTNQWSGRYQFKNVREPQSVWGKLNPIGLKLNVSVVDSNQHFLIKAYTKTSDTANVTAGGVTSLYKGDDVPQPNFNPDTAAGELTRVRRNIPNPIPFANNSAKVPPAEANKLQFLGTYLSRINNPVFKIDITGHSSKTGSADHNLKLSQERADNVASILSDAGATQHKVTAKGVGMAGASPDASWRKVEVEADIPAGWQNLQDVTAHEFGHMLGLDDEYAAGRGPLAEHHDLVVKAFGQQYADQVAKAGDTDYASVMEGGNDVRVQHYVTFWQGLVEAAKKAPVPKDSFDYKDWKIIG